MKAAHHVEGPQLAWFNSWEQESPLALGPAPVRSLPGQFLPPPASVSGLQCTWVLCALPEAQAQPHPCTGAGARTPRRRRARSGGG